LIYNDNQMSAADALVQPIMRDGAGDECEIAMQRRDRGDAFASLVESWRSVGRHIDDMVSDVSS